MDDDSARRKLDEFLNRYSSRDERLSKIANLVRYLDGDPENVKPLDIVPLDEYERRFLAVEAILRTQRRNTGSEWYQFTRVQFSAMMAMPLASLERFSKGDLTTAYCLPHVEPILKRCKYVLLSLTQVHTTNRHQS